MEIAVFLNENRIVLPSFSTGVVEVYSDNSGEWACVNQIPFELTESLSLMDINLRMRMLISEFENCEIIVVESIRGLIRAILEEFRIGIWQFKGEFVSPLLDKVKEELLKVKATTAVKNVIAPNIVGEAKDLNYEINLASVLENCCELNSKEILIPFIQNTSFRQLSITCNHIPKWFESLVNLLELNYKTFEINDGLTQIIVKPVDFEAGLAKRRFMKLNIGGCSSGGC
jgi:Fe-only nitrogenase accessory protein AnfO